jgi:hypothetical protein
MCPLESYIRKKLEKSFDDIANKRLTEQQTKIEALLNEQRQQMLSEVPS